MSMLPQNSTYLRRLDRDVDDSCAWPPLGGDERCNMLLQPAQPSTMFLGAVSPVTPAAKFQRREAVPSCLSARLMVHDRRFFVSHDLFLKGGRVPVTVSSSQQLCVSSFMGD